MRISILDLIYQNGIKDQKKGGVLINILKQSILFLLGRV